MNAGKRKLPTRWFGYDKRETEAYLRKLQAMQSMETEKLESQLKEQRSQNAQLQAKIEELSKQSAPVPSDADKISLLFERLERSVQAIDRQGEAEAESLRRLMERKQQRHERKMAEWEDRFASSSEALDFLLGEAHALIGKIKLNERQVPIEQLEREAEEAMQAVPERLPDQAEADDPEDESSAEREIETSERAANAKVLQFKLRSILKEAAVSEENVLDSKVRMTADGMSLEEDAKSEEREPDRKHETKWWEREKPSAFWGDLEPYLEDSPSGNEGGRTEAVVFDDDHEDPAAGTPNAEPVSIPFANKKPALPEDVRETVAVSKESPGLTEEILSIQNRYIVGKVSGEALYAGDGRLIVAKGQTITADIVQLAEAEGKLPELIIHMVIPGFGVDPS